jgi:hypothetical protein
MLWLGTAASLLSLGLNLGMDSLTGTWLALIPVALFNQNFSVSKVRRHTAHAAVTLTLVHGVRRT